YDTGSTTTTPFAMGLVQTLLVALGLGVAAYRWLRTRRGDSNDTPRPFDIFHFSFFILGLIISTFMITPLSSVLWDRLPLLPFVQFPWRFLSVQSLFASAIIGWIVDDGGGTTDASIAPLRSSIVAGGLAAFCILPTLISLHPDFIPLTDA